MAPASPSPPAAVSQQTSILSKLAQPFGCVHCFPYTNIVNYSRGATALCVYLPSITAPHQHRANRLGWKATWREINRKLMKDQSDAPGKSLLKTRSLPARSLSSSIHQRRNASSSHVSLLLTLDCSTLFTSRPHSSKGFFLPTHIGQKWQVTKRRAGNKHTYTHTVGSLGNDSNHSLFSKQQLWHGEQLIHVREAANQLVMLTRAVLAHFLQLGKLQTQEVKLDCHPPGSNSTSGQDCHDTQQQQRYHLTPRFITESSLHASTVTHLYFAPLLYTCE